MSDRKTDDELLAQARKYPPKITLEISPTQRAEIVWYENGTMDLTGVDGPVSRRRTGIAGDHLVAQVLKRALLGVTSGLMLAKMTIGEDPTTPPSDN